MFVLQTTVVFGETIGHNLPSLVRSVLRLCRVSGLVIVDLVGVSDLCAKTERVERDVVVARLICASVDTKIMLRARTPRQAISHMLENIGFPDSARSKSASDFLAGSVEFGEARCRCHHESCVETAVGNFQLKHKG